MELKYPHHLTEGKRTRSSNCTFMELKLTKAPKAKERSSNCTFMELKYAMNYKIMQEQKF